MEDMRDFAGWGSVRGRKYGKETRKVDAVKGRLRVFPSPELEARLRDKVKFAGSIRMLAAPCFDAVALAKD